VLPSSIQEKTVMRTSVFLLAGLTILSITSANAAPQAASPPAVTPVSSVGCSLSSGGYLRGCRNTANFKTYEECKQAGVKRGWRHEDMSLYCSGLGLQ
jgi:hypothetical protein